MEPIDVVIAWVDGDDPRHRRKRAAYLAGKESDISGDVAAETRFRSEGEIFFCVASILRFAPFVRKIHIITDEQNPGLDDFVARHFPENRIPIEIVDHRTIFRGCEEALPTFNSLSIETLLYRIPGLSEWFVYFNDDFLLVNPLMPGDWLDRGRPVLYGYWHNTLTARACRLWGRLRRGGRRQFKHRDGMLNAADLLGGQALWRFFRPLHVPHVLNRTLCEEFYAAHPEALAQNIRHRFRDVTQFNPQSLFQTVMAQRGDCVIRPHKDDILYIKPQATRTARFERDMARLVATREARFCCINSLDEGSPEQQRAIRVWIGERLGIPFDDPGRKEGPEGAQETRRQKGPDGSDRE